MTSKCQNGRQPQNILKENAILKCQNGNSIKKLKMEDDLKRFKWKTQKERQPQNFKMKDDYFFFASLVMAAWSNGASERSKLF